jgi:HAD superfamily hydrolase (TIGR01509 family)
LPPLSLLIFDCDSVLIDSEVIGCRAEAACLAKLGIAISADELIDRYTGIAMPAMLADLQSRLGQALPALSPDLAEAMRWATAAAFEAELQPMSGIVDLLAALPYRRCVASGSAPERLRHTLSLTGLLPHFAPHIFSAAEVAHGKPAPDLFMFAAERMGVAPADCVVIEDSVPGMQAATAAGMRAIGFTGGSHCRPDHGERLRRAGAAAVCTDLADLPGLL